MQTLQSQLAAERTRREGAEREADVLARECGELELRLSLLEGCQVRLVEAEAEVAELRELWRADGARNGKAGRSLPDALFLLSPERAGTGCWRGGGRDRLKRCSSERQLRVSEEGDGNGDEDGERDEEGVDGVGVGISCCRHERACLGRSEVVKQRGISLLNEVDAQYSALQVKYDALLRRCEGGQAQAQSHKAVQTPVGTSASSTASTTATTTGTNATAVVGTHSVAVGVEEDAQLPEYKVLFHEIFKCIQRSKADIIQNRVKPRHVE